MSDFYDLSNKFNDNLTSIINSSSAEISKWFDSDFKKFEPGNPDYDLYVNVLKSANELFIKNIRDYHEWLDDNFIVSPKNQ